MGSQRISVVSDQANGFGCSKEKTDTFVVDVKSFSHLLDKDSNHSSPNSRITRNLSRKGSPRGAGDKRKGSSPTFNERDGSLLSVSSSSPKASTVDSNMPEALSGTVSTGTLDPPTNPQGHHQITITAGNVGTNNAESKWNNRRSYSFRRPPPSWGIDPRKIMFFFATLSSMGTILLIFLTLSMREVSTE